MTGHGISSCHSLATEAARNSLSHGGNIIDAAVTAAFVLQVVEPHLNGPGGELVALVSTRMSGEPVCICGVGAAPAAATVTSFRDRGYDLVPPVGVPSAPVPGQFHALVTMLETFGTMSLHQVLEPARTMARDGFPVTQSLHQALETSEKGTFSHWPRTREFWIPQGVPHVGALMRNAVLANTFSNLIDVSRKARDRTAGHLAALHYWYQGPIAQAIADHAVEAVDTACGEPLPGLLTLDDLAAHETLIEDPVRNTVGEYTIVKAGPWTQGPVLPLALRIFDSALASSGESDEASYVHTMIEAIRLAMADRDAYLGDGVAYTEALLTPEYISSRASLITHEAARDDAPGLLPGVEYWLPPRRDLDAPMSQAPWAPERLGFGDTCHISLINHEGEAISLTASGGWLQSSPVIEVLGFALSTRLQQTWLDPRSPSGLRPGRRPRVTLTPTLVLGEERPVLSLGTPGGDGQDQWQMHALIRMLRQGLPPDRAVADYACQSLSFNNSFWPRERIPRGVLLEASAPAALVRELAGRGHRLFTVPPNSLGRLSIVARDPITGSLRAAVSPRSGYASAIVI